MSSETTSSKDSGAPVNTHSELTTGPSIEPSTLYADSNSSVVVCVSGATGYIASHIIQQLLARGYRVRGTVRSLKDASKNAFLLKIASDLSASERLELVEADLLVEHSFDKAVEGCEYVLHTASPFIIGKVDNPQATFVDPAVHGTKNILASVNASTTVKRVVLTSSVAAVYGSPKERGIGHVFTEEDWNTTSSLEDGAYSLSKRLAEEAAWEVVKQQNRWQLVTINPGLVLGPTLSGRDDTASIGFLQKFFKGDYKTGAADLEFGFVDVRDVARAHIEGMVTPDISGRFITVNESLNMLAVADILRPHYPLYPLPTRNLPKFLLYLVGPIIGGISWKFISESVSVPVKFDNSKIKKDLNFQFLSIRKTLIDQTESMLTHNLINSKNKK